MRIQLICFLLLCCFRQVMAQPGWNWPEDQELFGKAQEQEAFYKINIQLEEWEKAINSLHWLYTNNPELHESIYIAGVKVMEKILATDPPEERANALRDSLLWTYDMRIRYFDKDAEVYDRKAYSAFKLYYKSPEQFALLADLYEKAYDENGGNISTFNFTPYMTLAKYYHQREPEEMPAEKVLDIHGKISDAIAEKKEKGTESAERLKKEQDKVDALLSSIGNILTCDFIANELVPRLDENPEDLNISKKIFTYALKAKCSDQPYFTRAGAVIFDNDPTYGLASTLGNKHLAREEYEVAVEYFSMAYELATMDEEKYESLVNLSLAHSKLDNKPKSRELAYQALSVKPGDSRVYNIIGNLYYTSYDGCRAGESKVIDRAIFIAAYKMYEKAGNTDQMKAASDQFPSIEEIFNEGYEENDVVQIGCWINEAVSLMRRD